MMTEKVVQLRLQIWVFPTTSHHKTAVSILFCKGGSGTIVSVSVERQITEPYICAACCRQRLNGQWGIVDVDDCANAAKHLAKEGKVKPSGSEEYYKGLTC